MLFRETVAVYCENHTEHTHCVGRVWVWVWVWVLHYDRQPVGQFVLE
jgi:hypothetical protein